MTKLSPFPSLEGVTATWMSTSTTTMRVPNPGANARIGERKEFLDYQLDTLQGKEVLTRLMVLHGMANRRHGGVNVDFVPSLSLLFPRFL